MERQEPQGEENGDSFAALTAISRSVDSAQQHLLAVRRNDQARLTPVSTTPYSRQLMDSPLGFVRDGQASRYAAVASPAGHSDMMMAKLNPSVYSHPMTVQDPLLATTPSRGLSYLGRKPNIDMTSSGAYFDPKAVSKLSSTDPSSQSDIIAQLTREMKLQSSGLFSGSSDVSSSGGSTNALNVSSSSTSAVITASLTDKLAHLQGSSLLGSPMKSVRSSLVPNSMVDTPTRHTGMRNNYGGSDSSFTSTELTGSTASATKTSLSIGSTTTGRRYSNPPKLATDASDAPIASPRLGKKAAPDNLVLLSRSQPDLFTGIDGTGTSPTKGSPDHSDHRRLDTIQAENKQLRVELQDMAKKVSKVTTLEQEMTKIHQVK